MEGATCAIPASPELVILPTALIEVRETDIFIADTPQGDEAISYALTLSTAPKSTVRIEIVKKPALVAKCLSHNDGLELSTHIIEFDASNYDHPQIVTIFVRRDSALFQGNRVASFAHIVKSEVCR